MASISVSVPSEKLAENLADTGAEVVVWKMDGPPPRQVIDIVVPPYMSAGEGLPLLADVRTRLVQGQSIGYEGTEEKLPAGVVFANASTVHETSTAELALALTLAAQREFVRFVRAQTEGEWSPVRADSLADRRVLVLGYGGVGKAIAARLAPFEVEIIPVASTARDEDGVHVHAVGELEDLLPTAEIVITSLPGGESTRHIIDDAFLASLPDGALVVNVGRGSLVDTDALVDHVRRGRIRAALDVTEPEPLPADHPLWTLDGVLIAPHVGGATSAMFPRVERLIRRQIEHLQRGEEPENVVIRT
ncbi:2-hydroxyacid dehydrogenase [Microbacterium sp. EYE_5]|uniref:2-hydroxyacid dehydrogenase n=1 Tax=unclassified Microbacterium TaxID=2609290 RepID=UPI002005E593|nr:MULTISPECIES: 2-hydroxyacid dehydrogenase [unclassified Microbacterium]MCK6079670.1 2-hydroxyacid dehydrogenase [Microbacterium sp. EYE_382]MCK6084941.1 2-hydroxyacid dehydrogenase [Microbacterium sp. EYE_384]MCK6122833.1 2-hydroxyacid dehydrogenase [Microbacterium sp. EYE_80]MCK6125704.1 2-hydroxyacid dehydrogenase [Microbacterium sp. EYE_79]MCK6140625.1 2-hydroxyacid dehydrogenase [Microbacterium sp. EYE_39]